jgi:hypothetical protein
VPDDLPLHASDQMEQPLRGLQEALAHIIEGLQWQLQGARGRARAAQDAVYRLAVLRLGVADANVYHLGVWQKREGLTRHPTHDA